MELKVFKNTLTAYGGRWETRLELPVETEILIPDYLPAVFKIVKCLVEPVLMQNRVAAARWQGEGYLRCTVYYQSDEAGTQLYRTEQKFPFEKAVELPEGSYLQGPARVWGEPEYVNCRAVSEHRIDLRGAYALCVSAEGVREQELLTALADCGIEQRTEAFTGCGCVAAEEKTATAEDTIPLPGVGESILDISGFATTEEVSVQTGQLSFKGTLHMQVCYRPAGEGGAACREKEIPVQQTMELDGVAEGDDATVWGELLSSTLTAGEGDGAPTLTVTWKLHAELWRGGSYTAVADAYSTLCKTETTRVSWQVLQQADALAETVRADVSDTLPETATEVKGCFVTLGSLTPVQGEGEAATLLVGKGTAHILCADERGELACFDKPFAWQLGKAWSGAPESYTAHAYAVLTRVNAVKDGGDMKVSMEIGVTGTLFHAQRIDAVGDVELGELIPDKSEGPSLYLYCAQEDERIFDIAKNYHARAKDLAAANHLEVEAGQTLPELKSKAGFLLIPAAL